MADRDPMSIRITNRLFGTHPIVAHCPGALPDRWEPFARAVLAVPPRRFRCDDLTILTWNHGSPSCKPNGVLEKSLHLLGVSPVVLGGGLAKWKNLCKLRLTADALQEVATPYVLGADSADAVVLDDPSLLVERFEAHYTCELLFNATGPPCWPDLPEYVAYESSRPLAAVAQGRHFLNSGVWIGHTGFCRTFLTALAQEPPVRGFEWSEQAVIKRAWPRWYPHVQLDYRAILFQWFKEDPAVFLFDRR